MKVRNPRNGRYDYKLKVDSQEEIERIAHELRKNQSVWLDSGIEERSKVLLNFAHNLEQSKERLLEQLSIDTGRRKISSIEIEGTIGLIKGRSYSAPKILAQAPERDSIMNSHIKVRQQNVPYALTAVISPWNFPLLLSLIDTIPALLAGSAVLLKPSEVTPRFMDVLESIISKTSGLDQVLQLVRGGAEQGKKLVDTADVICFTGSVSTGMKISQQCAQRFIPAFLELGGKDPAIILEDADLDSTSDAVLLSCAGATGQACQSLERIYIAETRHDDFVNVLVDKINVLSFNSDYEKGGQIGPLIFDQQAQKIKTQIADAVEKGAQVITGGTIENINGGLYMMPTVLTHVTHEMDVMTEETFGPVIPIMKYSNLDEAIQLANDSKYGLSASVFSADKQKAIIVAEQIDAGGISINDASLTNRVFDAEKHAFKLSGLYGSRMGKEGLTRFFRKKAILIQTNTPKTIMGHSE